MSISGRKLRVGAVDARKATTSVQAALGRRFLSLQLQCSAAELMRAMVVVATTELEGTGARIVFCRENVACFAVESLYDCYDAGGSSDRDADPVPSLDAAVERMASTVLKGIMARLGVMDSDLALRACLHWGCSPDILACQGFKEVALSRL